MNRRALSVVLMSGLSAVGAVGCETAGSEDTGWAGAIDTLPSGRVVVANTSQPVWPAGREWRVIEDLRIGSLEGQGPDLFGRIASLEVDSAGRIYVFESQAQELRVFNSDGTHLRTIGRKGGGPGEFAQAVMIELGPDGNLWVPDPQNNRVSVFDTSGVLLYSRPAPGGFVIIPWPGGFDDRGFYYSPVFVPAEAGSEFRFDVALARFDPELQPLDTIMPPRAPWDGSDRRFEVRGESGFLAAGIPFTPSFQWRLHGSGNFWALLGGEYRLLELEPGGDTLREVSREYEPYPVTEEDIEAATEDLEWFVEQGGKVDRSRFPSTKPGASRFFFDDEDYLWVMRITTTEDQNRVLDVFDPVGRYLGEVRLPFRLSNLAPVVRNSTMWALTTDELDVQYVVRARIVKSSE